MIERGGGTKEERTRMEREKMTGDAGQNSKMLATVQNSKKPEPNSLDWATSFIDSVAMCFYSKTLF